MKRPWQIWLLYAIGLSGVAAALVWLTAQALKLDGAQLLAQRQAELEEDITAALWRMDSMLSPLLAEEAARPDYVYQAVLPVQRLPGKKAEPATDRELSPLLTDPPEHVLLHFQIDASGRLSSPQCPLDTDRDWAIAQGVAAEAIDKATSRLTELRSAIAYPALWAQCSPQPLVDRDIRQDKANLPPQMANPQAIANPYEEVVQQQLKNFSAPLSQQAVPSAVIPNAAFPSQQVEESSARSAQGLNAPAGQIGPPAAPEAANNLGNNSIESGRLARPQSRAGSDLAKRDAALQSYAQKAFADQRGNLLTAPITVRVVEGVSRPFWLDGRLLVARRVQVGDQSFVQGCWLDWPQLKERLKTEVADLLPAAELTAVSAAQPIKLSRLLAALPVQLTLPPLSPPAAAWTPIRVSLLIAWLCVLVTAAAAAILLHGVITLSERRGAFVSAVTHELRTPLTTFRMYAEMLSEGMVADAAQRQQYLETLRIEADRLAHLVENVLQYARLERGRPGKRREDVVLSALLDRCQSRLVDRAAQAEMKLEMLISDFDRGVTVPTDAAAVEQILFNLVDNACKYASQAADKRIHVQVASEPRWVQIAVRDHGPGISAAGRKKLFRPFSKSVHEAASSAPGVGLGLALSRRLAWELGGRLELRSPAEGGAAFVLTLPR